MTLTIEFCSSVGGSSSVFPRFPYVEYDILLIGDIFFRIVLCEDILKLNFKGDNI